MADGTVNYEVKVDVPTASIDAGTEKLAKLEKELKKLQTPGRTKGLEADMHGLGKSHDSLAHRIRGMFGQVGHSFNYAKTEAHELLEIFGVMAAFEIGHKIIEGLYEIGSEALKAAAAAERMDLAFKLSLGTEGGAEMVEFLDRISGKTEFTDDQLKSWGKELLNAGVAAEELDKFMAAGLDVAAKSPDKMEGMGKAIQALSRASLTGAVDARQLRGLSIGVEQLKTLPKFANLSVKQLKKEMTDGKLTKEDLLAVIAGPDKILGDLGIQAGKTMEARMLHLRHIPEEIFQKLAKTQAWDRLGGSLDKVLEKLDPEGPVAKKIFAALESALGKFADVVDGIDFGEIADVIADDIIPALGHMVEAIKPTIEAVERVIRGLGRMHEFLAGSDKKESAFDTVGRGFRRMAHLATGDVAGDLKIQMEAPKLKAGGKVVGEAAGTGMAAGIEKSRPKVKQEAVDMGDAAIAGTKKKLDAHSPSVVFEDIGGMAAAGFAAGIRGGSGQVASAVDAMVRTPSAGGGGGGGGAPAITVTIEKIDIHAGGTSPGQMEDAARAFTATMRPLLIGVFEEIAVEWGAGL